ncbi:hypothetical protein [Actinoplanes sp. HUAS TT8]|uniref:hypothetical protein n=1 Tax=Actinoplanes sp. HUAS TT8 TaxID=3447453 RepID=UPI003F51CBBB
MACEPLSLPLESVGELPLLLVEDESVVLESLFDVVFVDESLLVEVAVSDAYAATPIARVPATLAATSAPVISDVRRSPASRFIRCSSR